MSKLVFNELEILILCKLIYVFNNVIVYLIDLCYRIGFNKYIVHLYLYLKYES